MMQESTPPSSKPEDIAKWVHDRALRGARIAVKETKDPRFSYVLNWILGIIAIFVSAGGLATISLLMDMRVQMAVLTGRPEPATKDQLNFTNTRLDDLKRQVDKLEQHK